MSFYSRYRLLSTDEMLASVDAHRSKLVHAGVKVDALDDVLRWREDIQLAAYHNVTYDPDTGDMSELDPHLATLVSQIELWTSARYDILCCVLGETAACLYRDRSFQEVEDDAYGYDYDADLEAEACECAEAHAEALRWLD